MNTKDFFLKIDEILEIDAGTTNGSETFEDDNTFDSLAVLGLILFLDEECGVVMTPGEIAELKTVKGLCDSVFAAA